MKRAVRLAVVVLLLGLPSLVMAFPTTQILDNFNRANEGPPPSANWAGPWEQSSGLVVSGNQCAPSATGNKDAYWSAATFGPNVEAFVTIATIPTTDGASIRLGVRIVEPGPGDNSTTADGYIAMWQFVAASTDSVRLFSLTNGATTELGTGVLLDMADGDQLGLEAIGSTIKVYTKSGAGAWTERRSETDATYSAAGYIGLQLIADAGIRCDDFGGGRVLAPQRTLMGVGR